MRRLAGRSRAREAYFACASGEARSFVHETTLRTVSRLVPLPTPSRCAGEGAAAVWPPARPPPIAISSRTRADRALVLILADDPSAPLAAKAVAADSFASQLALPDELV